MTGQSWNTPISHTSDATFRLWGSELATKLAAIGLVQTADTGQINWATVTRPAVNVYAGYEIWRFNDSLQGSAPIFFKLEYGTSNTANGPATRITVGTGSNGSGTITGQSTAATVCCHTGALTDAVTNRQSYACAVDGIAWVTTKYGAGGTDVNAVSFKIERTVDSTGAPTTTGFLLYACQATTTAGTPTVQFVRTIATASTFAANTSGLYTFVPHGITNSVTGSDTQAFLHWVPTPKVAPVLGSCSMLFAEAAFGTSFSTTLVGTTPRTYLSVGRSFGDGPTALPTIAMCCIYE